MKNRRGKIKATRYIYYFQRKSISVKLPYKVHVCSVNVSKPLLKEENFNTISGCEHNRQNLLAVSGYHTNNVRSNACRRMKIRSNTLANVQCTLNAENQRHIKFVECGPNTFAGIEF